MVMQRVDAPGWKPEKNQKKTSIGRKNIKMSSMNKKKKGSYKKYRGQG